MSQLTLVPSAGLTLPSQSTTRPNRFILFTESWLNLQNYIQSCLALPITTAEFEKTYGTFAQRSLVDGALDAMRKVKSLTGDFGNPGILKRRISAEPACLFTQTPPAEIYSHIVWLALQMQNVAGTFKHTFENLDKILGPRAGTPAERAQNLKELLVGAGGLVSRAEDMRKKTNALIAKLATFEGKMSDANEQMARYTNQQSEILEAANKLVGHYTDQIENVLIPASHAAWKAWRDFTIAAVTVSVGLAIAGTLMVVLAPVTFGTTGIIGMGLDGAAVVAAGVLGKLATKQREIYNDLLNQIASAEADKARKVALVKDLTALNTQITLVGTGLSDFRSVLQLIEGIWVDVGGKLSYICSNYTVEQLGDLPFVTQAFDILDAQTKWGEIATTTQEFTQNSLVDYRTAERGERIAV